MANSPLSHEDMRLLPMSDALTQSSPSRVGGNGCICGIQLRVLTPLLSSLQIEALLQLFPCSSRRGFESQSNPPFFQAFE